MSEIRKPLFQSIMDVKKGKMPLDTAGQVHLLAHRHVMDRYADEKTARRIGDEKVEEGLKDAQDELKKL